MTDRTNQEETLEALLAEARRAPPKMPEALMARVLADAQAQQAPVAPRWRRVLAGLGGLPAVGGLVTATCVGFWLGIAPPEALPDLGGTMLSLAVEIEGDVDTPGFGDFGWDVDGG